MAKEIERKFLIESDAWQSQISHPGIRFRQAYIASMDDRSVRVRLRDDKTALLTIKVGTGLLCRDEFEFPISCAEAEEMVRHAIGVVIDKTRFVIEHEGYRWEVDRYNGVHQGLVVAEVELSSECEHPPLPDWVGREVTGLRAFSNQALATDGLSARHQPPPRLAAG
ncbi:CYTH domain-containing protein [Rhizobium sp. RU20A]|uniref:CYTH domain-containing protein n=1 Tax=Rhizobium sp. RU20A TaxID=1907412 RepID=UPI0009574109|nr:CYTH domain-containing protein [Rhizobium sp. RU20A]SIR00333.1 CYTH domain-containing protein [Rhizobium sp. RU20A]